MSQKEQFQQLSQRSENIGENIQDVQQTEQQNQIAINLDGQETKNSFQEKLRNFSQSRVFYISLIILGLILMVFSTRQIAYLLKDQCKVQDLVDQKVTIQDCGGKLYQMRHQNKMRGPSQDINDHYEIKISIDEMINMSPFKMIDKFQEMVTKVNKEQSLRAVRLLEVVHNVNYKGEFVFDHFNFYPSPEAKAQALFKVLQEEKQYFDQKYDINKYIHDQIGICVYVPSYNNAKNRLYLRNLDSIFQQEYQNYHVVYVNDASTDGTGEYVKSYMQENEIPAEKYVIINNEKNRGNCANVYNAGHNYCKEGEIMIFLDGDDALIGRQVFALLNAVYQKEKVALTYGQFIVLKDNFLFQGFSRQIPSEFLLNGKFRQKKKFYSSHLKTMYVDLFRKIQQSDLQYDNGTFLDTASDVAYMTSAIQLSGKRLKFLTEINYEYHFDTGSNDNHYKQMSASYIIYKKRPSQAQQNFPFADNPKTVHYI